MTTHDTHANNLDLRMTRLAALAAEEVEAVRALLPVALDVQWDRSLATRGEREDTGRRATGGHSDPTADIATDGGRLHVRRVLTKGESHLEEAVVRLRGLRRGIERALTHWEGNTEDRAEVMQG